MIASVIASLSTTSAGDAPALISQNTQFASVELTRRGFYRCRFLALARWTRCAALRLLVDVAATVNEGGAPVSSAR